MNNEDGRSSTSWDEWRRYQAEMINGDTDASRDGFRRDLDWFVIFASAFLRRWFQNQLNAESQGVRSVLLSLNLVTISEGYWGFETSDQTDSQIVKLS